jgi:EPS-associated MarR family transcriptional regulator
VFKDERKNKFAPFEQITPVTSDAVAVGSPDDQGLSDRAELRFRVMRALEQNPTLSQRDLARALGVSLGGINYCIKALIDRGAVKVENFRASDSKMRYAYILTPEGIGEKARMTGRFVQKKMREYAALKAEIEGLQGELGEVSVDDGV